MFKATKAGAGGQGVLIRAASKATIDEVAPEAYKDATEVVDTKVARLRPLIVVKG